MDDQGIEGAGPEASRRFEEGKDYETSIQTAVGSVGLLAEVHISGTTLTLKDAAIYPYDAAKLRVGIRAMRSLFRQVADEAKADGFSYLRVTAKRYSGARRGRAVDVIINLRE
jgi:hypothetical protein